MTPTILLLTIALQTPAQVADAPTRGRRCSGTVSCYQTYQQPYYQPQPYYPPLYYHQQKVIGQEVYLPPPPAPLYATVPVESYGIPVQAYAPSYYWSVSEAYREKAYLREVVREELRTFANGNAGTTQQPTPAQPTPAQPTPAQPTPAQPATVQATQLIRDTVTPADLQTRVMAALSGKANCLSCHGASGKAQGMNGKEFRLVVAGANGATALASLSSDKRWKIHAMATSGFMPPLASTDPSKAVESKHWPTLYEYAKQAKP